jgi:hypothetical protein
MSLPLEITSKHKLRAGGILKTSGVSAAEKKQTLWAYIFNQEISAGTQFIRTKPDKRLYTILGATSEILPLPVHTRGGDRMYGYLFEMYGLDRTDYITGSVYEHFRTEAINHGVEAELRRFATYVRDTNTVYMSSYDGMMWKISGNTEPERVKSGDDGQFFIDDDNGQTIEPEYGDHGILLDALTNLNYETGPAGITAEMQKKFLIVWLFAQAFPDLLPDKPVMLLEGVKGSGKTTAPLLIQVVLTGSYQLMSISNDQDKDFGVLLLKKPIAVLDNMDTFIDWLQDKIARYCTMGTFPRRKLFTDDEEINIEPKSFIAITSRNPSTFRRDDVCDRLIIVRLKRFENFATAQELIADVRQKRSKLFGEYLYHVGRIVEAIGQGGYDEKQTEKWRMASFARFTRLVGRVFGWDAAEVEEMLETMQNERDVFEGEGDPLVEIMQEWIAYRPKGRPSPVGQEFALSELFKSFSTLAKGKEVPFPYKHLNRLADKLTSNYVARHFKIEMRNDEKTSTKFYRIWRHTDPVLETVDGDEDNLIEFEGLPEPEVRVRIIKKG